jgi:16S rRNA processing protein RimM
MGEFYIRPTTERLDRFQSLKRFFIGRHFSPQEVITINSIKITSKGEVLVRVREWKNPETVRKWSGYSVLIPQDEMIIFKKGTYHVDEILGLTVVAESGIKVGTVTDILLLPANDVYVVTTLKGEEVMIPVHDEVVRDIDPGKGQIVIKIMEYLE